MGSLIKQVPLNSTQKKIKGEKTRELAKLRNLEIQVRKEIEQLTPLLSEEELNKVEETLVDDKITDDVPKYLSVAEIAGIMDISPQMVRRNCVSGKYQGYQPSGSNGIWFINSDTFRNGPKKEWIDFISRRNDLLSRSKEVAELAKKLQNEETEEIDNVAEE